MSLKPCPTTRPSDAELLSLFRADEISNPPLRVCYRLGWTRAGYGWSTYGDGGQWPKPQQAAFRQGVADQGRGTYNPPAEVWPGPTE